MFSEEELDCIACYAGIYRDSVDRLVRERMFRFINLKLQDKLPNLPFVTMCRVLTSLHPSIDISDIADSENTPAGPLPPRPPFESRYIPPLSTLRPYTPPLSTLRPYTPPIPYAPVRSIAQVERDARRKDLEERSRQLNSSLSKYTELTCERRERFERFERIERGVDQTVTDRARRAREADEKSLYARENVRTMIDTDWMDSAERECYKALTEEERDSLMVCYKKMKDAEPEQSHPLRIRILMSNIPDRKKLEIFNRLEQHLPSFGEGPKYSAWVTSLLKVPFGVHTSLPCNSDDPIKAHEFLTDARKVFDSEIYGHPKVKDEFISILGSWIQLGSSCGQGNVIGLAGPVGVGKTSLAKSLARVLGRPIYFISLGGSCYSSMLNGHAYTYEGASYGEVARAVMEARCMDPVFFFDELDKVSSNDRGEEIIHMLIHLTDPAQNTDFVDRYFAGVPLDMSKALFVFSYNDKEKVNHILRDRIHEICLKDFDKDEKTIIAREYVIPAICSEMQIADPELFKFADGALSHLVDLCNKSTGLRLLKTILIRLLRIVVVAVVTDRQTILSVDDDAFSETFDITKDIVDVIYSNHQEGQVEESGPPSHWYT